MVGGILPDWRRFGNLFHGVASALLGFEALGLAGPGDIDRFCAVRARFEPRREHRGLHDDLYSRYRQACEGFCPVFDALKDPHDGSEPGDLEA